MSCRSGYSNAAYCSMYDGDGDGDESFWDRETPLGAPGSPRHCESPASTPRKVHRPRQRSFSAPRNSTATVLAPMIAQARVAGVSSTGIRRSRSAVFTDERRMSHSSDLSHRGAPARRTICPQSTDSYQRIPVANGYQRSYGHRITPQLQEPPMSSWEPLLPQSRNLAVIPPNTRPRPEPLPPSPTKGSWAALPAASTPTNTLFLSGLFLIFASSINCLLCFYLLAKKGRHYYIDLAVMSGFAMLVLGYAAVRTGRWDWVFNRNYLAGYMVLSMLDVLLCGVLGLLASDWRPPHMPEIVEVASGAVCGLSALMLLLALFLCASSCCRHPPPDNRVSHSVPSLIV